MSQSLIEKFLSNDETTCEAEAIALGEQGPSGLPDLQTLLAASDPDARFWAVRGLWANGSTEAVQLLIDTLQDEEEMVRSGTALALGEMKAEAAVDALGQILTTDRGSTGNHATDALGKIGSASADVLIEALKSEESWVRVRAVKALVPVEARKSIGPLFHALIGDESYMVRHYAEIALDRMGVGQMVYFT